jgi:hypothetical protein
MNRNFIRNYLLVFGMGVAGGLLLAILMPARYREKLADAGRPLGIFPNSRDYEGERYPFTVPTDGQYRVFQVMSNDPDTPKVVTVPPSSPERPIERTNVSFVPTNSLFDLPGRVRDTNAYFKPGFKGKDR